MDITTVGGIVAAFGLILLGQLLEGGHVGSILQATAALIVFGGTLGAVMVAYPKKDFLRGFKLLKLAFSDPKIDLSGLSKRIVEYAGVARRDGVLALEGRLGEVDDPFLRRALQFVVDGVDAAVTRSTLEAAIDADFDEQVVGAKVWESAGGFSPTIGILGAVLGLIHVMENLNDPSKLGGGIAVAFVATVYGVGSANILFLPWANKIKRKLALEKERKTLIAEGVLSIQEGINPRVLEEKLRAWTGEEAAPGEAEKKAA
ncbi:MAG TPA: flagellar motor protein [Anaeromyxobacter sp.]|nr:flagellar motor protein [Anaeromyxobacter sp.]